MKLAQIKVMAFSAPSTDGLTTQPNTWIAANGRERTYLAIAFSAGESAYSALLTYTE